MRFFAAAVIAAAALAVPAAATGASHPLIPALTSWPAEGALPATMLARIKATGATAIRVGIDWSTVAPKTQPDDVFDPTNPADPGYDWSRADAVVTGAVDAGLQPILTIGGAPLWAQGGPAAPSAGPDRPDPKKLAQFATAAARRYSGTFETLPRVRYWELWNEPNLQQYLSPQFVRGRAYSPDWYRTMTNAFADAVHAVSRTNAVVVGGLAPFTFRTARGQQSVSPMAFMRQFLCMSAGAHPHPTCSTSVRFDVWTHHPYTSGNPTHKAQNPNDISLGDLSKMTDLLNAAWKAGHIRAPRKPQFWVTEFSWDSKPPDPKGVPTVLETRWVAEAAYRMWAAGVSLFTWFAIDDLPYPQTQFQSGLYYKNGKPKPALESFRFPVVAFPEGSLIHVWLRTPSGKRGRVVIEQSWVGGWKRLGLVTTDANGIFEKRFRRAAVGGAVRARLLPSGERSRAFALKAPPDYPVDPFGS